MLRSPMTPNPEPDPDATVSDAQEAEKCLAEFHAFALSHDAYLTAGVVDEARETLDRVIELQSWLDHYGEALRLLA
jgi:hypothetical protein